MARCLRCNAGNEWIEGTVGDTSVRDDALCRVVDLEDQITDLQRQLAEAKAEIEAMRPMVESCKAMYERHHTPVHLSVLDSDTCYCLTCQWYRDYTVKLFLTRTRLIR